MQHCLDELGLIAAELFQMLKVDLGTLLRLVLVVEVVAEVLFIFLFFNLLQVGSVFVVVNIWVQKFEFLFLGILLLSGVEKLSLEFWDLLK